MLLYNCTVPDKMKRNSNTKQVLLSSGSRVLYKNVEVPKVQDNHQDQEPEQETTGSAMNEFHVETVCTHLKIPDSILLYGPVIGRTINPTYGNAVSLGSEIQCDNQNASSPSNSLPPTNNVHLILQN
jgi:hypothetical protein